MHNSYHLVHILKQYGGTESNVSSHNTLSDAISAYRSCGGPHNNPQHMIIRHMGLVVWDSTVAKG